MQKFFKLSAERMRIICGVAESRIFRVTGIETNMIGGAGFDAFVTLDSGDGWYKGAYMGKLEMFAARGEFVTEAEYLAQDAAPVVVPACAPGEQLAVMALAGRINRECLDCLEIPETDGELMLVAMPHGVVTMFTDMNGYATPEECYSAAPHAHRIIAPSWNAYVVDLTKRAAPECMAFLADVPQESNRAIMARAVAFVRDIRLTAEYLAAKEGDDEEEQERALAHEQARAERARKLGNAALAGYIARECASNRDRMATEHCETCGCALESGQIGDCDACQEDDNPSGFINHYKCHACAFEWADEWSCMVDDDCPECGARHCSPYLSEDVA